MFQLRKFIFYTVNELILKVMPVMMFQDKLY